jgi:Condensation domain
MSRDDVNAPFAGSTWDVGVHRNLKRLRKLPTNELTRRLAGLSMCSLNQRRLWFAYVLDSRSNAYNVPLVWSIEGRLDVQAMKQAWVRLVERHDVLRSIYFPHGEDVYLIALALDSVISQVVIHEAEGIDGPSILSLVCPRDAC